MKLCYEYVSHTHKETNDTWDGIMSGAKIGLPPLPSFGYYDPQYMKFNVQYDDFYLSELFLISRHPRTETGPNPTRRATTGQFYRQDALPAIIIRPSCGLT